jgi:predicted RNA-binding protein YlxR (DUF448 family)
MTTAFKRANKKADASTGEKTPDGARRCLVSGEMKPRAEMIRFVIGPENAVLPDLSENLPGHGLWVTATHDAVQTAVTKKLFKEAKNVPASLADDTARLLRKRCLQFLGLAKGAGLATLGESQTEASLRAQKLALYLHAPDATRTLDNRFSITACDLFSRDELGAAFGYPQIVYAGISPHGLAKKLMMEINRLRAMTVKLDTGKSEG